MKLRGKLKLLILYRYRYLISMPKDVFLKLRINSYQLKIDNENVIFFAYKIDKNIKNNPEIKIIDQHQCLFVSIFKNRFITSLSIFFILLLFLTSTLFIREIDFSDSSTYNYMVLSDLKSYLKKVGPFYYIDNNLNDISNALRVKYFDYSYIGVRKKGAKLLIDIEKMEEYPDILEPDNLPCDVISGVDGKVVGLESKEGLSVVNINDIVTKGQILISGNLNYHLGIINNDNLVHANGYVLIEYANYEKVKIPKIIFYNDLTYAHEKYLNFNFFNINIGKSRVNYNEYYILENKIIEIDKYISIRQIIKYEMVKKEQKLSLIEAKELAISKIHENFFNDKVSEKEQIKQIKYVQFEETNSEYIFHFLVKYIKNETIIKYYEGND